MGATRLRCGSHCRMLAQFLEQSALPLHRRDLSVSPALLQLIHPPSISLVHSPPCVDVVGLPSAVTLLNCSKKLRILCILRVGIREAPENITKGAISACYLDLALQFYWLASLFDDKCNEFWRFPHFLQDSRPSSRPLKQSQTYASCRSVPSSPSRLLAPACQCIVWVHHAGPRMSDTTTCMQLQASKVERKNPHSILQTRRPANLLQL